MADIVGIDKILKHIARYDVRKIKLSKGADTVFLARCKPGQDPEELQAEFAAWVEDFIDSGNFANYKLQLFGTDKEDDGKTNLSLITSASVAFHDRAAVTGGRDPHFRNGSNPSPALDLERFVSMAAENATLKAQLERMEEKMDEILADDEDEEEDAAGGIPAPRNFQEAIGQALMGKIDTIVDIALGALAKHVVPGVSSHPGVAGVPVSSFQEMMYDFNKIHPEIEEDIARFYSLAKNNPAFFTAVIQQLRQMVP
jgi:hypothetical protein